MQAVRGAVRRRFVPLALNPFLQYAPPGHFYSPIPDASARSQAFDASITSVAGVNLRVDQQVALLAEFARFMPEMPFRDQASDGLRFGFANSYFSYSDGTVLYGMLRQYRPRRIIEVGSGYSSAVMLDTADRFGLDLTCTFIEPYPKNRLLGLLTQADRAKHRIITDGVQDVPLDTFDALQANDILFIDSSHVGKLGSDVLHLLTHVLPRLKPGVLIHVHDIFWPFDYPNEWVREGRAWNEAYLLRAFLQFNDAFAIRLFTSYLHVHHRDALERYVPVVLHGHGGSMYIQRC